MQLCDHGDQHWMMIISSRMELLELFLAVASNLTKDVDIRVYFAKQIQGVNTYCNVFRKD
jgi:hypothetical protein